MATKSNTISTPSIIGSDVEIHGNVKTTSELQLDGKITGDLTCGSLVMGESGAIQGKITANSVTTRGKIYGQIYAKTVRLEKSAIVEGDVYHENLSVEAGAKISGQFSHTTELNLSEQQNQTLNEVPSFVKDQKAAE